MKYFVIRRKSCNFATKLDYIKRVRHIFAHIAWTIVCVYAVLVVLLHIPAVQRFMASTASDALAEKLHTKVRIGNVNLGFLNRLIIDDILVEDQQRQKMLQCHRVSAKIDVLPLLSGRVSISSIQLFGLRGLLTQASADAPLNCQFLIDAFASKDTTSHTPLDLQISSLVVRNTSLHYDRLDQPRKPSGLDLNHIAVDKVSSHIILYTLTDDSLSIRLKTLSFIERNTGFNLEKLAFSLNAGKKQATLNDFNLLTEHSDISIECSADYDNKKLKRFNISSEHSSISTRDVACFVRELTGINKTLFLDADIAGNESSVSIRKLAMRSFEKDIDISLSAMLSSPRPVANVFDDINSMAFTADIKPIHISSNVIQQLKPFLGSASDVISRVGDIDYTAQVSGKNGNIDYHGRLLSAIGSIDHALQKDGDAVTANIKTSVLDLGHLFDSGVIGNTELSADIKAAIHTTDWKSFSFGNAEAVITAPQLTIYDYPYRNVGINVRKQDTHVSLSSELADLNVNAVVNVSAENAGELFNGNVAELRDIVANFSVANFNPHALGITDKWHNTSFAFNASASIGSLNKPLADASAVIDNFSMSSPDRQYGFNSLVLRATDNEQNEKVITLQSDFADIEAYGTFTPETLPISLKNIISSKLPTLPGLSSYHPVDNFLNMTARLKDTEFLRALLDVDVTASKPVRLDTYINDRLGVTDIIMDAPSMTCFGMQLEGSHFEAHSMDDTLRVSAKSTRTNSDGSHFSARLKAAASNNTITTSASWNQGDDNSFRGTLNARSQLFFGNDGGATASVNILPSDVMIADTVWHLHPSRVLYSDKHLKVDNFLVENGNQHIGINGQVTDNASDSISVSLSDVNVGYIMNIIDFHSVEFNGRATGTVVGKTLFTEPQAYTRLTVSNFLFENGRLGTLKANGRWDNILGQINIDASCFDEDVIPLREQLTDFSDASRKALFTDRNGSLKINGYISLKRSYIDLGIKADNVRLEFVHTYTDSFLDNINAWATGNVHVIGPLSSINLVGEATANGSVRVIPLNTVYTLHDDYVRMIPDEIIFQNDTIYDKFSNHAVVNGALHHESLSNMTFDLDVDAKHLLCFNFPELDGASFCGYVIGSGSCRMKGRPGVVDFDIDAYPEKSSYITYNASSPDALQNQEFITWRDGSVQDSITTHTSYSSFVPAGSIHDEDESDDASDFQTNIHLNFLVHATPDCTLRVIMDQRTGDYIALNGTGTLQASYYNKGSMQIFGNYGVESGEYKMTIQKVITKSFDFMPGGTIAFAGDPFDAVIDLQARYIVPSASLSDLNIGNSFRNTTVRVNCLMNISGTPEQPVIDFDLNIPQASTDVQQMITSLMDSEEARNQQVVYLLSIGRFYSVNANDAATSTQASLAMQSFLSGTVSQQLNNLISDVIIKNDNWNFGANISPGDEGMMNAEYEGLVSGRMLNNRLLINGQFGYRDNVNATTSFIGDFDVRYLLFPNGNLQVRVYNQTSDRYFTKSNLNTQGLGIILKHDFKSLVPYFLRKKDKSKK